MKELCEYSKQQQKLRGAEHRRKHSHEGSCSGLTDAEYNRVQISGKKSYSAKARKFTHNRMWKHQSRYSVKQLIEIVLLEMLADRGYVGETTHEQTNIYTPITNLNITKGQRQNTAKEQSLNPLLDT